MHIFKDKVALVTGSTAKAWGAALRLHLHMKG